MSQETDFNASGSKYLRQILLTADGKVDVYAVIDAFRVTCPASQHAIKKLLCAGIRGKGSVLQDLREAFDATGRAIQMEEQRQSAISPARYAEIHTPLTTEEVAAISKNIGQCATCGRSGLCEGNWPCHAGGCSGYKEVAAISEGVLDLSLPSITLECTAVEAAKKYEEEVDEWAIAKQDSMEELVELWDALQAAYTWRDHDGGDSAEEAVEESIERIRRDVDSGLPVFAAKSAMLLKNATRPSPIGTGYYAPETCAIIIESGGTRWQ